MVSKFVSKSASKLLAGLSVYKVGLVCRGFEGFVARRRGCSFCYNEEEALNLVFFNT